MPENNTSVAPNWKARYLDLAQQQSTESDAAAETEKLLCRIIIRLTLATNGLDPTLDPHLTGLRNAVRKGVRPELKERLSAISEALIRANDESTSSEDIEVGLLPRLISRSGLTGRNASKLRKVGERLVADGDNATDEQIDSFLRLLTRRDDQAASPGFLSRLFSSASSSMSDEEATPNQQLLKLLERLDWPNQLSHDIKRFERELSAQKGEGVWVDVMTSLVSLLTKSLGEVHSEIVDTRGFLEELTRRLVEIDQHARGSKDLRKQSMVDGRVLDQVMKHQVGGIRENMGTATSLQQLREDIGQRLDAIELHVGKFVTNENARHHEAAQLEEHLRKRLEEVQSESRELRSKMIEAHRQAATDTVTSLPNRLAYEERLEQEFARWKRFGEPLSLLVWDVDDFKHINDRFGHHAGDKALRVIGHSLQVGLRETDFVARFGGEEFVMLLPGTNSDDAKMVADAARIEVNDSGIHSVGNRVEVTISCGLSQFIDGDTPTEVFSRADRALYEAKKAGKNRIVAL